MAPPENINLSSKQDIDAKGCYDLRNQAIEIPLTLTFQLENSNYFAHDVSTHPENVHNNEVGVVLREPIPKDGDRMRALFNSLFYPVPWLGKDTVLKRKDHIAVTPFFYYPLKARSPAFGHEEDPVTKDARETRIGNFQTAANQISKLDPTTLLDHKMVGLINKETEKIIASVTAKEVDNLPSETSNIVAKATQGSIEIALVTSSNPDKRPYLLFSLNSGSIDLSAVEQFTYLKSCFCECCSKGDFFYSYKLKTNVKGKFFALDADEILDFCVDREDTRSFAASAPQTLPCVCYCVNCCKCCTFCLGCCECCGLCDCPCTYKNTFLATDHLEVGAEPPMVRDVPFVEPTTGVTWNMSSEGQELLFLTLTYKSRITGNLRNTKIKLDRKTTFVDAKKFASALQAVKKPVPSKTKISESFFSD